jgi:hypothetical protein
MRSGESSFKNWERIQAMAERAGGGSSSGVGTGMAAALTPVTG